MRSYRINGRSYNFAELQGLIEQKTSNVIVPGWERKIFHFISDWIGPKRTIQVTTSGSIRKPRVIDIPKVRMRKSARLTGRTFNIVVNQRALCCLPVDYIAGKMMIVRALELGMDLILVEPSSNLQNMVPGDSIKLAAMVPMQLHSSLEEKDGLNVLNAIDTLLLGGGTVSHLLRKALEGVDCAVFQTYGMTETVSHVAIRAINGTDRKEEYKALKGIQFASTSDNRLIINAPHIEINSIETTDLVHLISSTRFKWLGRADNIINSGGIKIIPEVVEEKLEQILIGKSYFIGSLPDEKLGEVVVLMIEDKIWTERRIAHLDEQISDVLGTYEKPKKIFFVKEFSHTPTGKIHRVNTMNMLR
ncbi:MAG: AMP-binding protein [Candidatus Neomarinimicrobiota bacterium]